MNSEWERAYLQAHPISPKPLGWRWYLGLAGEVAVGLAVFIAVIVATSLAV